MRGGARLPEPNLFFRPKVVPIVRNRPAFIIAILSPILKESYKTIENNSIMISHR